MSGVMYFDSKEEMDLMACFLLGKGKTITPRVKIERFRNNTNVVQYQFSVNPQVRWSSQNTYDQKIQEYQAQVNTMLGLKTDPSTLTHRQMVEKANTLWLCKCTPAPFRSMAHDKCFKCGNSISDTGSRHPNTEETLVYLKEKHDAGE